MSRTYDGGSGAPLVKEEHTRPKGHPFTIRDRGGPRELKAHENDTRFRMRVRCDKRGGYIVVDRVRNSTTICGSTIDPRDPNRKLKPTDIEWPLYDWDDKRFALESLDKGLDIIERERALIDYFRLAGEDNPFRAMEKRLVAEEKIWDKAVEIGVSPSDFLDAQMQDIDPQELAAMGQYKLAPMKVMRKPGEKKADKKSGKN